MSQINRYAIAWLLAGSCEDAVGMQVVSSDDLIPVVDISTPVDAYSTGIPATVYPTTPASPIHYPHYPPPGPQTPGPYHSDDDVCPQTPEYRPYFGDDDDIPNDLILSPIPIPCRVPAWPAPPTLPSPHSPQDYSPEPAPPPMPVKKISKRKASAIHELKSRVAKR
jgi:hypothetical protein